MSFLKQEGIDLKDVVNGELRFRNVYLYPNLYGRKIRIEYPSNWTKNENADITFIDDFLKDLGLTRRCILHIAKEDVELSDAEWAAMFSLFKYAHDMSGTSDNETTILESQLVEIDTLPGVLTIFEHTFIQQPPILYSKAINLMTGYKNTMITLTCLATSDNLKDSAELFETSKKLFLDIIRSFKCLDMWESYEAR